MGSELCVSVIVPHNKSMIRRALPSAGSLRSGSPTSSVLRLAPTPCNPSRRTSFPSLGGTALRPLVMTRSVGAPSSSRFGFAGPWSGNLHAETTGSPRFLGSPLDYMPCSQIPAGRRHQAIRCLTYCLPPHLRRRLPRQLDVGTQSHGLQPRCLRFAARVTPEPRKTRFRLAANLDRMGLDTHRTPKMVSVIQFIHPPSPSFPSAQAVQSAARTTRTQPPESPTPSPSRQPTSRHPSNPGIPPEIPPTGHTAPPPRPPRPS